MLRVEVWAADSHLEARLKLWICMKWPKKVKKGRELGLDPQTNTYQLYKGDHEDIPKRKITVWEQR